LLDRINGLAKKEFPDGNKLNFSEVFKVIDASVLNWSRRLTLGLN